MTDDHARGLARIGQHLSEAHAAIYAEDWPAANIALAQVWEAATALQRALPQPAPANFIGF